MYSSLFGKLVALLALLVSVPACNEIVIEPPAGSVMTRRTFYVKGSSREVDISSEKPGRLEPGEEISVEGDDYVAGADGAMLSIRGGKLIISGARPRK